MADVLAIKELVARYEIPRLVHFTRAENLPSIMEKGILPRSDFELEDVICSVNDDLRLDGRLNGISLSIAFPNSRMLWSLRQKNPTVRWVVLGISKSVLWENACAFCRHNAADRRISERPLEELQNPAALASMYDQIPGHGREEQGLNSYDPTDVQAEILAFGKISPEKITRAAFQRPATKDQYAAIMPDRKLIVDWDKGFFSDRRYNRKNGMTNG